MNDLILTVIIVTYNSEEYIQQCVSSIYKKKNEIKYEVIIVDNSSNDSTVSVIQNVYPEVILIKNNQNVGFAKANNQAIKTAKGKYLLLLNPDTQITDETIEKFYSFMQNGENENIWCVGGILIDENNNFQFSFGRFPRLFDVFFEQFGFHKIFKNYYLKEILQLNKCIPSDNINVDFVSGACMFLRTKLLDEIGLFDESFFLTYEETELAFRASKKGYKAIILSDLFLKHRGQKSFETTDDYILNLKIGQLLYF